MIGCFFFVGWCFCWSVEIVMIGWFFFGSKEDSVSTNQAETSTKECRFFFVGVFLWEWLCFFTGFNTRGFCWSVCLGLAEMCLFLIGLEVVEKSLCFIMIVRFGTCWWFLVCGTVFFLRREHFLWWFSQGAKVSINANGPFLLDFPNISVSIMCISICTFTQVYRYSI